MKIQAGVHCTLLFHKCTPPDERQVLIKGIFDDQVWVMYLDTFTSEILELKDVHLSGPKTIPAPTKPMFERTSDRNWAYWNGEFWVPTTDPTVFETWEELNG